MNSRRTFLKNTALAGLALTGPAACTDRQSLQSGSNAPAPDALPMAIATWAPNTKATDAAMEVLSKGGRALDAVEAGARVPEADPQDSSVGFGGLPDRKGLVTLDACIMDEVGNAGSVTFLQHILHPVSVARKVMEDTPHVMLSGQGALEFARSYDFEERELLTEKAREAYENWQAKQAQKVEMPAGNHDTIGIMAIDQAGDISGACTTSGTGFKIHGRVGDSPIIGAGMYVDNEVGGAVATGWGELVMKTLGSFLIVELMRGGKSPQEACEVAVNRIVAKYKEELRNDFGVGYLAIDKSGRHGAYSVGPNFDYALYQQGENKVLKSNSWRK